MNKQLIKIILFDIKSNLFSCLLLTFQMIVAFFVIGNLCSITAYKTVTVNGHILDKSITLNKSDIGLNNISN